MNNFTNTKEMVEKTINDYKTKFEENGMVFDKEREFIFRAGIVHGMSLAGIMLSEMDNLVDIVMGEENDNNEQETEKEV